MPGKKSSNMLLSKTCASYTHRAQDTTNKVCIFCGKPITLSITGTMVTVLQGKKKKPYEFYDAFLANTNSSIVSSFWNNTTSGSDGNG